MLGGAPCVDARQAEAGMIELTVGLLILVVAIYFISKK